MAGKGSRPRPFSVSLSEFDNNFDRIFGSKNIPTLENEEMWSQQVIDEEDMQVRANNQGIGNCGCGRSPTGKCIGWHGLTEEEFQTKLAEYKQTLVEKRD
jgi:hypothetical protein